MRLAIRQSKLPACLAEVQLAFKILSGIYATGLVKLTEWMKSVSMGSFKYKNQVNGESFAYLWVILLYLSQESTLDSSSVGIWSSQFVLNFTDFTQLSNRSLRVFSADFPRDVCLTVSRNHAVFLLYPFTNSRVEVWGRMNYFIILYNGWN